MSRIPPSRPWPFFSPHDFVREADTLIDDALDSVRAKHVVEDAAYLREMQTELRKWAWENSFNPETNYLGRETQALRLLKFLETGAFDDKS